jgi:hypothetical protein
MVYLTTAVNSADYIASNIRMINEYLMGKDTEGSSRGLIKGTFPAFSWRD